MILRAALLVAAATGCFVGSLAAFAGDTGAALAAGSADAMKSSVVVRGVVPPGSQVVNSGNVAPADGQTYIQIMVTLRDLSGNAVPGKTVVLQQTAGFPHGVTVTNIYGPGNSMVTNQNGVATFDITSTTPDTLQFRAQDVTDSISFSGQTATVIFTAYSATPTPSPSPTVGPADPVNSSVVVWGVVPPGSQYVSSGSVAPADGRTQIDIMITLKDWRGNRVVGRTVVLQQTAGFPRGITVTNTTGAGNSMVSSQNGVATFSVTSTTPGQLQFMARDTTDALTFTNQPAVITFTAYSSPTPSPSSTPEPQHTAPVVAAQVADDNSWSANAIKYRGRNGQHFTYACSSGGPPFAVGGDNFSGVYGTDIYTDDSPVCLAAVHAGLISLRTGGKVTIEIRPKASSYAGSARNGITTIDYGTCECGSYVFASAGP